MLKNILKLEGAQQLTATEQKETIGGKPVWCGYCQCENNTIAFACGNQASVCMEACRDNS